MNTINKISIIDYSSLLLENATLDSHNYLSSLGLLAFNCAPEVGSFIVYLKKKYNIDIAIETGTYKGNTTIFLSNLFEEVHTIEIDDNTVVNLKSKLDCFNNIKLHHGNSKNILKEILPKYRHKMILIYLDAHWEEEWPILDELSIISKTHYNNCVIIIDDIKVPFKNDIPYDTYNNVELTYEYIKNKLSNIYSNYKYTYIVPKDVRSRAKLVVMPAHM